MAKISEKRFDGHYKITTTGTDSNVTVKTHSLTVDGNLVVQGNTTSVETTNSTISDNTIVLNEGETGAGVTATTSGIEVDRGTADNATLLYDDSIDSWTVKAGSSLTTISAAQPTQNDHLATKQYVDSATGSGGIDKIVENDTQVEVVDTATDQYIQAKINNTEVLLVRPGPVLAVGNVEYSNNAITNVTTNDNIRIDTQGTGEVISNSVIRLEHTTDPSGTAGASKIYSKAVSGGGTGVFVTTPAGAQDEMVSKSKAIVFGLIF